MAVEAPPKLVTAEQFANWSDNGLRHELVEGVVISMPPPGELHGIVIGTLSGLLWLWIRATGLGRLLGGDTGYVLRRNPDTVRGADVSIRLKRVGEEQVIAGYRENAPDLVVEVLSPSNRAGEVLRKVGEYLDAGARMVWVVNPEARTVTVYRGADQVRALATGDVLDGEDVLPGFSCRVAEIFQDLD